MESIIDHKHKLFPPLTQHYPIRSYDVDMRNRVKLSTLFGFSQEIAYHHASDLGVGPQHLHEDGNMWVLSRVSFTINRYPYWREVLKVSTQPTGMNALFALRNFEFRDEEDVMVATAATAWLVVNIKNRRPQRPIYLQQKMGLETNVNAPMQEGLEKIAALENPSFCHMHHILFSDLDMLKHVNNTRYIEWLCNCFHPDFFLNNHIDQLDINFLHESKFDEDILISKEVSDQAALIEGIRKREEIAAFRARLNWKQAN